MSLLSPDWPVSGAGDRLPGVGVWRGWGAGGPTHLRFMGRTLTATLTDAMAHHGPGPRGLPAGLHPAAAGHFSNCARAPAHFPLTRPSAGADLELLGGHTCQATEHAQNGSGPRDPRTGVWLLPTVRRGGARKPGHRLLSGLALESIATSCAYQLTGKAKSCQALRNQEKEDHCI